MRAHYQKPEYKAQNIVRQRERLKDPEARRKHNARIKVFQALKDGRLVMPEACEDCGIDGPLHGHHEDYGKPLDVNWVCRNCHVNRHEKWGGKSRSID